MGVANCSMNGADEAKNENKMDENQFVAEKRAFTTSKFTCYMKYRIASTVKPVYSGHLGTQQNCPYYRGVLISECPQFDCIIL